VTGVQTCALPILEDTDTDIFYEDLLVNVRCSKTKIGDENYFINLSASNQTFNVVFGDILDENGLNYASLAIWEDFIFGVTGQANCISGGGSGTTNLSYTSSPLNGLVNSSTGTSATLPLVDYINAGLKYPADKIK